MIEHYTEAGRGWGVRELQTIVLCLSVCLSFTNSMFCGILKKMRHAMPSMLKET